MRKTTRITALLLALALLLPLLPATALGAEVAEEPEAVVQDVETEDEETETEDADETAGTAAEETEEADEPVAVSEEDIATASDVVASGTCGNDLTWVLDDAGTLTISGTGKMTELSSSTSAPWYSYHDQILSVVIEDGVTYLARNSFCYCSNITDVSIPDSVTSIGHSAFFECYALTEVTIPNSVTSIESETFYMCTSLTNVVIGSGVDYIASYAFAWCSNLTSVSIGDSVTSIRDHAFVGCTSLTFLTLPLSVTNIGNYAFYTGNTDNKPTLTDLYYAGTKDDWAAISVGSLNNQITNATVHYDSTGSGAFSAYFAGGDGTESRPYQVATADQLDAVRNDLTACYIQTDHIDLSDRGAWTPIGSLSEPFEGTYDGNGNDITGLSIGTESLVYDTYTYAGLFGYNSGELTDICLRNCTVDIALSGTAQDLQYTYIGGVVGCSIKKLTQCSTSGSVNLAIDEADFSYLATVRIGGVVGSGTCSYCTNYAEITITVENPGYGNNRANAFCGGIVGEPYGTAGTVTHCVNYGDITAEGNSFLFCGGISGEHGAITNCVNYGDISGTIIACSSYPGNFAANCNIGGIVGATHSDTNDSCVNYGNISSTKSITNSRCSCAAGGIAGYIGFYSNGTISNCYNLGAEITSASDNNPGRIAASLIISQTSECYSLETTTINGEIPDEADTGTTTKHGASLTYEEIVAKIADILNAVGIEGSTEKVTDYTWIFEQDNFSFINSRLAFGFGAYYIEDDMLHDYLSTLENTDILKIASKYGAESGYRRMFTKLENLLNNNLVIFEGSCYGMSLVSALIKTGALSAEDLGAETTYQLGPLKWTQNTTLESIINLYQISIWTASVCQCAIGGNVTITAEDGEAPFSELMADIWMIANKIGTEEEPFLIRLGHSDGRTGHAVVCYGAESGDFSTGSFFSKTSYSKRLLIYDPNSTEEAYIYISDDFAYAELDSKGSYEKDFDEFGVFGGDKGNGSYSALIKYLDIPHVIYLDVDNLDMSVYRIVSGDGAYADIADGVVVGGNLDVDLVWPVGVLADGEEADADNEIYTVYLPYTSATYQIIPAEGESLDALLIYDDFSVGVSGTASSATFGTDGTVTVDGADGDLEISTALNNSEFDYVGIVGTADGAISVQVSDEYVEVTGDISDYVVENMNNDCETSGVYVEDSTDVQTVMEDGIINSYVDLDNDGEYETVMPHTHYYRFVDNGDHTHTATCIGGDDSYTESHTFVDGVCIYCGATHTYATPTWFWATDHSAATATFTCTGCGDAQTVDAVVTYEVTEAANSVSTGTAVYTATVTFDGETYTDTQTVTVPKIVLTAPTVTALFNSTYGITIRWEAIEGATEYIVWRLNNTTGRWERCATTTEPNYISTSPVSGTTYYYAIEATDGYTSTGRGPQRYIHYLATPKVSLENTSSGVKISWTKAGGAKSGYQIWRRTADSDYEQIGTVSSINTLTWTDETAALGVRYYYMVRSVSGSARSAYASQYITRLTAPTGISVSNVKNGVQVKWNAVTGAKSYQIWRKTPGGSWARVGSTSDTTYISTGVSSGNTYIFTVKAAYNSSVSAYSTTGKTIMRLAEPTITLENLVGGLTASWNAVDGAKGYKLYRRSETGSYVLVATLDADTLSYTDKAAGAGLVFYYRVQAYNGSYTSSWTSQFNRRIGHTTLSLAKGEDGVVLEWTVSGGCTGYYIYRMNEDGSYTRIKTITSANTLTWTDTDVEPGNSYTYYIRGYNGSSLGSYTPKNIDF